MTGRIPISELQVVVDKAVANLKLKPGPIIIGLIAADISAIEAKALAEEVTKLTGLTGEPTVVTIGGTAETQAALAHTSRLTNPRHIIGLIKSER